MEYALRIFAALSDPLRLRSLALMAKEGTICACELTHALQAGQPTISKHLAYLREVGLVTVRRDAQWVFNSIAPDLPRWVRDVLAAYLGSLGNDPTHQSDIERLLRMSVRPPRSRAVGNSQSSMDNRRQQ